MKIYCARCKKYLGEILKATLHPDKEFICKTCLAILTADKTVERLKNMMGMK
jgi:hypothetical protein